MGHEVSACAAGSVHMFEGVMSRLSRSAIGAACGVACAGTSVEAQPRVAIRCADVKVSCPP
jgi:hypothetical protein